MRGSNRVVRSGGHRALGFDHRVSLSGSIGGVTAHIPLLPACGRLLGLVLLAATACGDNLTNERCDLGPVVGPTIRFADPDEGLVDLVDHPFPSDALLRSDGLVELRHFPNPTESTTLQDYLQIFQREIRSFSTSAALYIGFTEAMDPASFPSDPGAALGDDAPISLVDIDPDSPERGRRYPLRIRYRDEAKVYLPAHHLAILPPFGATLRGGTTYALVLTDRLRSAAGASLVRPALFEAALDPGCANRASIRLRAAYEPLVAWLAEQPNPDAVVGATVFTTRDAVADVRALADAARAVTPPRPTGWSVLEPTNFSDRYEGRLELPAFQSGRRPYSSIADGGGLVRTESGFALDHFETSRLAVNVPARRDTPTEGWPVVLFSHGTGGDYTNVFNGAIADALAREGIAAIGYDGTLHGPRDPTESNPNLTFFNLFNPVAARDNVLQGAADLVTLTAAIGGIEIPADIAGQSIRFKSGPNGFFGTQPGGAGGRAISCGRQRAPRGGLFRARGDLDHHASRAVRHRRLCDVAHHAARLARGRPARRPAPGSQPDSTVYRARGPDRVRP